MKTGNVIRDKSYAFSLQVVEFCKELTWRSQYSLGDQLFRSGTSIGANIEEAIQGQSKRDFIAKLQISLKEANETRYWLRLVTDARIVPSHWTQSLIKDVGELINLLTAILKTAKASMNTVRR